MVRRKKKKQFGGGGGGGGGKERGGEKNNTGKRGGGVGGWGGNKIIKLTSTLPTNQATYRTQPALSNWHYVVAVVVFFVT